MTKDITIIKLKRNRRFRRRPNKQTPFHHTFQPPSLIINDSKHTLNAKQIQLLNKGMNFCPPFKINSDRAQFDLHKFRNRLRNQYKYGISENYTPRPFVLASQYEPKRSAEFLESFADHIQTYTVGQIQHQTPIKRKKRSSQHAIIKSLTDVKNITFKRSDKSGVWVILDDHAYLQECHRQLNDRGFYIPVRVNPLDRLCNRIEQVLQQMKDEKIITHANLKYLQPAIDTKTSNFYYIPKVHKQRIEGVFPGRPICSGCNSPLVGITKFVDFYLNPLLQQTDTYIKDSGHLLHKLQNIHNVNKSTFLVTADVKSLYTSIPQKDITTAVYDILEERPRPHFPPTNTILRLVDIILHNNYFEFNGTTYLQIRGVGMGLSSSPTFACLFMHCLERKFLPKQQLRPIFFGRYIDDILVVSNSSYGEIISFLRNMNEAHPHIKYTWNISNKKAIFLDLHIYKKLTRKNEYTLWSDLHTKSSDIKQYLHFQSNHPRHVFKSVAYGQALRIVRIVNDERKLTHRLRTLGYDLIHRGYPREMVTRQINKALHTRRNQPTDTTKKSGYLERVPLVLTYNRKLDGLAHFIHDKHATIINEPGMQERMPQPPLVAFRRPKNLGDHLIHSQFMDNSSEINTFAIHDSKRCKTCPQLARVHVVRSITNLKTIHVDRKLKCNSRNVIYAIVCKLCQKLYIGETGHQLNVRFSQHRYCIRQSTPTTPVAVHFNENKHKYEHASITPIIQIADETRRKTIEKRFIHTLCTTHPFGINHTPVPNANR